MWVQEIFIDSELPRDGCIDCVHDSTFPPCTLITVWYSIKINDDDTTLNIDHLVDDCKCLYHVEEVLL